jgi:hypothetical protein
MKLLGVSWISWFGTFNFRLEPIFTNFLRQLGQLPQKVMLGSEGVKIDLKIIISLRKFL